MKSMIIDLSICAVLYIIYLIIKAWLEKEIERLEAENLQLRSDALLSEGMREVEFGSSKTPFEYLLEQLEENPLTDETIEFLHEKNAEIEALIKSGNNLLKIYRRQKKPDSVTQKEIEMVERLVKIKQKIEERLKPGG